MVANIAGMDHRERNVAQRFEAKYMISEMQALAIRDFMEPYVNVDAYAPIYNVISLYLDTPRLTMHWSSELGEKNRYKLRIRAYNDDPDGPVFFEVKRRMDQIILKRRATIKREYIEPLLRGSHVPMTAMVKKGDAKGYENLMYFRDLMERMNASPRVTVRYQREAFASSMEEPVRVTFDRYLCCLHSRSYDPAIWRDDSPWHYPDMLPTVLEIKFTDQYPFWVSQMVRRFGLMRSSMAKYCDCVKSLERAGVQVAG